MRLRISKDLELSAVPHSLMATDATNEPKYIAPGTSGQILSLVAGVPTWITIPTQCEITSNASGLKLADTFYDSLVDDVTGTKTTYDKTLSSQEVYFIRDGCSLKGYVNNTALSNLNENLVIPVAANNLADFTYAHASLVHNDKIYLGLRGGSTASTDTKLLCYSDCNDLSVFQSINLGTATTFVNNIEAICYEPVTGKIIAPLSNTKQIVIADPSNITTYTTPTLAITPILAVSAPILVDTLGYFYVFTADPTSSIVKVNATTLAIVSITAIPGGESPHCGVVNADLNQAYICSTNGKFTKIDLATMTMSQLSISLPGPVAVVTDDMALIPGDPLFLTYGNPNLVIIGGEIRQRHAPDTGAVLIDTDNMAMFPLDFLPSWGVYYNTTEEMVYSVSNQGFIETIPLLNILDIASGLTTTIDFQTTTYTCRGFKPNEWLQTSCGNFVTSWWDTNIAPAPSGHLLKVDLLKVDNPLTTKTEMYYRG